MKFLQFSPREQCTKFPVAMAVTSRATTMRYLMEVGLKATESKLKRKKGHRK
ncbi:MAG: hypothetical protein WB689_34505 [Xanthobacteraceae bacterium]